MNNENNEKIDHINKKLISPDVDIETNKIHLFKKPS